jgi:hypothetical protein
MSSAARSESDRRPPAPRREPAFGGTATPNLAFPKLRELAIFPYSPGEIGGAGKKSEPICELFPMRAVLVETGQHTRTRGSPDQQAGTGGAGNDRPPVRGRCSASGVRVDPWARPADAITGSIDTDRPAMQVATVALGIAPRKLPVLTACQARPSRISTAIRRLSGSFPAPSPGFVPRRRCRSARHPFPLRPASVRSVRSFPLQFSSQEKAP